MQNLQESEFWITSLIGYFYQNGIGCIMDKNKALEYYLLVVNQNLNETQYFEESDRNDYLRFNQIIGKYLLAIFYYKDIIVDKRDRDVKFINDGNSFIQDQTGFSYYEDIENKEKYTKGGNSYVQRRLGDCYYYGKGVEID